MVFCCVAGKFPLPSGHGRRATQFGISMEQSAIGRHSFCKETPAGRRALQSADDPRRLKMRKRSTCWLAALALMLSFFAAAFAQAGQQQATTKSSAAPAPKRDLSGVWQYQGAGGAESFATKKIFLP